jgi:hypothetical protein
MSWKKSRESSLFLSAVSILRLKYLISPGSAENFHLLSESAIHSGRNPVHGDKGGNKCQSSKKRAS